MTSTAIQIENVVGHRNGIAGNGFVVVTFTDKELGRKMVGIVFDEPGNVAVFDRELLGQGNITFGVNSWRGDDYEDGLRAAVKEEYGDDDE